MLHPNTLVKHRLIVNETIQLQKIRLDLGKNFDEYWAKTNSYVKGLIGKPWWVNKQQLLACEGPITKMVEHCLIFVIEESDRIKGYKAYTTYLTLEYGTSQARLTKRVDMSTTDNVTPGLTHLKNQSPNENEDDEKIPDWLTKEQADFLFMHHKLGMPETAEMVGISEAAAWAQYRNIKAKVRYHA